MKAPRPGETAVLGCSRGVLPSVVRELEAGLGRKGIRARDVPQTGEQVVLDGHDRDVGQRRPYSSVGQTRCWTSRGTRKNVPSGSIWVAWASSAWSRRS